MARGEVRWFSKAKGFGFIRPEYGPKDVFVHASAVRRAGLSTLLAGQRLEFELTQMRDGRVAALGLLPLDGDSGETAVA
ncbi:cold-shock protein [Hankyongella ginsenosidimutans]|uniref:Cold-shock protein n=1 Tax=Hankyongella ginsenosidimutans TaxID=1763828 RepID=A0A4D7C833_9SPHN|nr:cold-shock protein [Hankyongella ginsenosidimutans]QCI80400.1 cold-shock protein [Hankyongella ginsenosidimutans]TXG82995.1 MAG: cold-shock protein [Sphingomonadales bacterium]